MLRLYSIIFLLCAYVLTHNILVSTGYANTYEKEWVEVSQQQISNVSKEMLSANFWQNIYDEQHGTGTSEKVIPKTVINAFNDFVKKRGWVLDVTHKGKNLNAKLILSYITEDISRLKNYIKHDHLGVRHRDPKFSDMANELVNLNLLTAKKKITVRYALLAKSANMLMLPGELFFSKNKREKNINILQNTYLPVSSPVAIYWLSADKKFAYAQSTHARGWVPLTSLTFVSKSQLKNYLHKKNTQVVLSHAAVFSSANNTSNLTTFSVPMGTRVIEVGPTGSLALSTYKHKKKYSFPINYSGNSKLSASKNAIEKPFMGEFYLVSGKVGKPLQLTRNNLLEQLFLSLGTPYAWGGAENATDCSLYFQYVFATFGMKLPRSSNLQTRAFSQFFKNRTIVTSGVNNLARIKNNNIFLAEFLYLTGPSHIMLSLGTLNNHEYVIHSTWGMDEDESTVSFLKQVVISTTKMGSGRPHGNLSKRLHTRSGVLLH